MKIKSIIFQENPDLAGTHYFKDDSKQVIVVLDMEEQSVINTNQIDHLAAKIESVLPGIFIENPGDGEHLCGGRDTDRELHTFRQEIETGTNLAHLMEHLLLFLLSKRTLHCAGYSGRKSDDLQRGQNSLYYIVVEYPSKLEALVAIDYVFNLVKSWVFNQPLAITPDLYMETLQNRLHTMLAN